MQGTIAALASRAEGCTACDLYARATQTVFGEGPADAALVVIGEQPGDHEDREGHPFVGPAGVLLDRAFADAGIDRDAVYVTNAVKHFKWEARGKVRLHKKPNATEVRACAQWWEAELDAIRPRVVVLLGATAVQAVLGSSARVTRDRGMLLRNAARGADAVVTLHPAAVLRARRPRRGVRGAGARPRGRGGGARRARGLTLRLSSVRCPAPPCSSAASRGPPRALPPPRGSSR